MLNSSPHVDAVIFDFNGTLSDDETLLSDIYLRLAAELGVELRRETYEEELRGRSDREIVTDLLSRRRPDAPPPQDDLVEEVGRRYNSAVAKSPTIGPGPRLVVEHLHGLGLPLAVVTGASRTTVLPALVAAGIDTRFSTVVTEEDVRAGKPDPEGLLLAADRLGLDRDAVVLVFEDSEPGLRAAVAAHMLPVAVGPIAQRTDSGIHLFAALPVLDGRATGLAFRARRRP